VEFVLDNSVSMRWLFGDGSHEDLAYADRVLEYMTEPGSVARVPSLWSLEVANVIPRAEARAFVSEARTSKFLALLQEMAIRADPETFERALDTTLALARRHALSAYDAAYLELAMRKGIPLATLDAGLCRAVREAQATRL